MGESWNPEQSAEKREARRNLAASQFPELADYAGDHGIALLAHTESHYQMRHPDGWILNVYPGNRRLYWDPNKKGLFLKLPENWTLRDVVIAAVERTDHATL